MIMKFDSLREKRKFNDEELMVELITLTKSNPKVTSAVNRLLNVIQTDWRDTPPNSLLDFSEQQLLDYYSYLLAAVQQNTETAIKHRKNGKRVVGLSTLPPLEQQLLGKFVLYGLYLKGELQEEYQFNPVILEVDVMHLSKSVNKQLLINFFRTMDAAVPKPEDYFTENKELAQFAAGILHLNIQEAESKKPGTKVLQEGKILKGVQKVMRLAKVIVEGETSEFFEMMDAIFADQKSYLSDMNLLIIRQTLLQLDDFGREKFIQMLPGLKNYPVSGPSWIKINDYWHDLFSPQQWGKINQGTKLRVISEQGLEAEGYTLGRAVKSETGRDMIDDLNDLVGDIDEKLIGDEILQELAAGIVRERSLGMSQDGHKLALKNEDSPLSAMIAEVRISRNKETGKPAIGIACNVNFRLKNEHTFYTKLNAQGELLIRALDANGKELRVVKKGEEPRLTDKLIGELNRVALEKLKMIYVRQKPTVAKALPENNVLIEAEAVNDIQSTVEEVVEKVVEEIQEIIPAEIKAGEVTTAVEKFLPEQLVFPEMIEQGWTQQGKEAPMRLDLTEKEKVLRNQISKKERIKIDSNMARVRDFFLKVRMMMLPDNENTQIELWPSWPVLDEDLRKQLKELFLHAVVKMDGEEYYEVIDGEKAYEKLQKRVLTLGNLFVRSKRAHTQALSYGLGVKSVLLEDGENVKRFWLAQRKEMSDQAKLKMDIFRSGEAGEEMNLADRNKILHFEVEGFSRNGQKSVARKIFENIESGRVAFLMKMAAEKEIREEQEEMKARAVEKYLSKGEVGRYEKVVERLEKRVQKKLDRVEGNLEEIRGLARAEVSEVIRPDGGTRQKVTLFLPSSGFKFGQTFNQGAFKSVADLLQWKSK